MRVRAAAVLALAVGLAGCAELGVVTDGSSISYGKPNRGRLVDGVKLPNDGPGYTTPSTWKQRGNRYGTNELIALIQGVGKRMKRKVKDARLVVADLSSNRGGEAHAFHRSHQNGRDVDLIYYERDADGKALEPDAMHVFDADLKAKDGSGITVDVPRTWALVRELLTADEAYVQYIFIYRPIAEALIDYAVKTHEPDVVLARAQRALKQPGDSAPHNDHMHVRVYCAETDRSFGCVDIGPMELLAEREAEAHDRATMIAQTIAPVKTDDAVDTDGGASTATALSLTAEAGAHERTAADVWAAQASTAASIAPTAGLTSLLKPAAR